MEIYKIILSFSSPANASPELARKYNKHINNALRELVEAAALIKDVDGPGCPPGCNLYNEIYRVIRNEVYALQFFRKKRGERNKHCRGGKHPHADHHPFQ